ncbi:MAG: amidase family protein [Victivallaceae bacterium]|nr:amidase family protein [Victivallaceae bacterium]
MKIDVKTLTIHGVADDLEKGRYTATDLAQAYLARLSEVEPKINAFAKYDADKLLAEAAASDQRRATGREFSPYDGIPIGIKDNISVKGETCSAGSKTLMDYVPPFDATLIKNLRENGFIPFGRTNMDELAMGSTTRTSVYGMTSNPWGMDYVPGGSSGGSAAAVAAAELPGAIGTDTGGSVRQPAAFCGVYGMKPTYGRISRYGIAAMASSLDQAGPLTRNVLDTAILLEAMGGADPLDGMTLPGPCTGLVEAVKNTDLSFLKGLRVGVVKEYMEWSELEDVCRSSVTNTLELLKSHGAEIIEVELPATLLATQAYFAIMMAEASTNLERVDGIRYGQQVPGAKLNDIYLNSRAQFGENAKLRLLAGTLITTNRCYQDYFVNAQKVRTELVNQFTEIFKKCDVLLTPTSPTMPARKDTPPSLKFQADFYGVDCNLSANCAISVPAEIAANGMPIGIQFIAAPKHDELLLKAVRAYELCRPAVEFIPNI